MYRHRDGWMSGLGENGIGKFFKAFTEKIFGFPVRFCFLSY